MKNVMQELQKQITWKKHEWLRRHQPKQDVNYLYMEAGEHRWDQFREGRGR